MAYAAVTCLRSTILRLLSCSRISVFSSTRRNMELAYEELGSFQKVLERSGGSSWLNALDGQIIGAVQKLEDSLESHELKQYLPQSAESYGDVELMHDISSFVETVKKIKQEEYYNKELYKSLPEEEEEEEEEEEGADGNDFERNMVGLSNQFDEIKQCLVEKYTYVFSIVGMAGIGKTALAKRIFHDAFIMKIFECRAFVRVGRNCELEELEQVILDQVIPNNEKHERLNEYLDDKRYLIVLDDVWDLGFWDDYFKDRHGDIAKGSCILLTTRVEDIVLSLSGAYYFYMPLLNNEESWDLLRGKVFAEKVCPLELENAGKEIAEKCDGLPLMLVTVADILISKDDTTQEYWNEVAHKKTRVFEDAYDQILNVLYPSYYNLPPQAKACFLYMAAFPPNLQVRRSKLVSLWCTEGFLEPNDSSPIKSFASECFDKLVLHHVVVPAGQLSSDGQSYQACSLHSVFRHLCKKELEKNEFLHVTDRYEDGSTQGKTSKRRVSIYNNVLLSIKDVYTSMESSPNARSLLCTGAYHKYQVPINFNLRLLKVCDALTIRFYEFPLEALELVQLRYFAITYNKNLPPCISKLWKLEYLIVHQHLSISSTLAESFLPAEVWDLQELIHLEITGRNLPNPPCDVALPNLVTLLDVGTYSCSKGVLRSVPNLEKLRVQIQLTPNSAEPLSNLDNISHLKRLLSLQCLIVNPILMSEVVDEPSFSVSPSSITKLTLSGLGYPWAYLNTIFKLPNLKVLKLLRYAFQGNEWDVEEEEFLKLECLSMEDNDLVQWKAGEGSFPNLSYLYLTSCYKLQQLPELSSLVQIELVDCNSAVNTWAAQQNDCYVTSSWDDVAKDKKNYISCIYETI